MSDVINGVSRDLLELLTDAAEHGTGINTPELMQARALLTSQPQSAPAGEREAFELRFNGCLSMRKNDHGQFTNYTTLAFYGGFQAGAAWQRTQSAVVADGWKLVPVEPTPEMLKSCRGYGISDPRVMEMAWGRMLAAAPAQPAAQGEFTRAHIMDALLMWNRRHEKPPIRIGYEYGVAKAVLDLATAQDWGSDKSSEVQRLREALHRIRDHAARVMDDEVFYEADSALTTSTGLAGFK